MKKWKVWLGVMIGAVAIVSMAACTSTTSVDDAETVDGADSSGEQSGGSLTYIRGTFTRMHVHNECPDTPCPDEVVATVDVRNDGTEAVTLSTSSNGFETCGHKSTMLTSTAILM